MIQHQYVQSPLYLRGYSIRINDRPRRRVLRRDFNLDLHKRSPFLLSAHQPSRVQYNRADCFCHVFGAEKQIIAGEMHGPVCKTENGRRFERHLPWSTFRSVLSRSVKAHHVLTVTSPSYHPPSGQHQTIHKPLKCLDFLDDSSVCQGA